MQLTRLQTGSCCNRNRLYVPLDMQKPFSSQLKLPHRIAVLQIPSTRSNAFRGIQVGRHLKPGRQSPLNILQSIERVSKTFHCPVEQA